MKEYVWYDVIMELCEEILCMIWFSTGIMWENMYDDVMIELCEEICMIWCYDRIMWVNMYDM